MRIAVITVACAAALAACGSSGKPASSASAQTGSKRDFGLTFARCMRAHGVNVPDPSGGANGIQIPVGTDTQSPAFKAARAACFKDLPGGGPGSGPPSAQARAQLLNISQCMRAHGISDFPDPASGPPPDPSSHAYSSVMGDGGYYLAIPMSINTQSPAFKTAATACRFGGP